MRRSPRFDPRDRPRARFAALAACALVTAGCNSHLIGTRDVRLDYEFDPGAAAAQNDPVGPEDSPLERTRRGIYGRLGAGEISADVDTTPPNLLHVTVDEDAVESVDEFLVWRGGLDLCRLDPDFVFAPYSLAGLTPKADWLPDGRVERYFEGSSDAVFRAVRMTPKTPGHRIVVDTAAGNLVRTRAVFDPPLVDLTTGIEQVRTEKGTTLALTLSRPAQTRLAEGAAHIEAKEPVAIVRDTSVVSTQTLDANDMRDGALLVHVGDDLYSYTRAQHIKRLLESPTLPRLARIGAERKPPNWPLAAASLALPMLLSFGWLFFVRRFDRVRPEPMWLVLATFALGGLSVIPAGLCEVLLPAITPYLNPTLMTLGGQMIALPLALVVFTIVVGFSEEGSKLLGAWVLARHRPEFDEPVDGIIYGAASALGFAAVENVRYFAEGRVGATLIVMRAFTTVPAHLFFGAIWGYALGRKLVAPKTSILLFLLLAAFMHGAFDTFLSIDGLGWCAGALNLGLASLFIVFLRSALRHGVVTPEAARASPASRELYRMGSRSLFAFFAVAMHIVAALIFGLGAYVQAHSWRVGFGFMGISTALLTVLGFLAFGLSEALPLDVVLDDHGLTFSGAAAQWGDVLRFEHRGDSGFGHLHEILVRTRGGSMHLGPGPAGTVERLAAAIAARLADGAVTLAGVGVSEEQTQG